MLFLSVCSTRCEVNTERDLLASIRFYFLNYFSDYYQITLIYGVCFFSSNVYNFFGKVLKRKTPQL